MDGDFTNHKPGYYTVKLFDPIEDFDADQYGNIWYNVLFEGDAETFMWLKKDPPTEGMKVYGHIEPTKSGKRLRFKTDKLPEGVAPSSGKSDKAENKYQRDITAIPLDVWRTLVGIQGVPENPEQFHRFFTTVQEHANELLDMIDKVRSGALGVSPPSPALKEVQENLSPKPAAAKSLGDTFRAKRVAEPPLEDYPEDI